MSSTGEVHHKLINGHGKCSVPMWSGGCPDGFCDKPAYGKRPKGDEWRDAYTGERKRFDGRWNGYAPGLLCSGHGGPTLKELSHNGDPCMHCGTAHDDVAKGPCPKKLEEWNAKSE